MHHVKAVKQALRLMSYGVYVLGVEHEGETRAATVTWVTQASFTPSLVVLCVRKDGGPFALLEASGKFALSILESGQKPIAFSFFKTATAQDGTLGGHPFETAETKCPVLTEAMGFLEGRVVHIDSTGDHAVVIGEVTNGGMKRQGEPLTLQELGLKYGG